MGKIIATFVSIILGYSFAEQKCGAPQEVSQLEYCGEPGKPARFCNHVPMDTITLVTAGHHICGELSNLKEAVKGFSNEKKEEQ